MGRGRGRGGGVLGEGVKPHPMFPAGTPFVTKENLQQQKYSGYTAMEDYILPTVATTTVEKIRATTARTVVKRIVATTTAKQ